MTKILRMNTPVDVLIGPFVAVANGYVTYASASPTVELSKNGQALAAKGDATVPVYDSLGYHNCEFSSADVDTAGQLDLVVEGSTTFLPIRHSFQVLAQVTYDSLYASAPSLITSQDIGQVYEAAISSATSQISVVMDVTIQSDDDWIGLTALVTDVSTGENCVRWVADVVAAEDRLILNAAPPFTAVATDKIRVESRMHPTYALNAYDPPTRGELGADRDTINDRIIAAAQLIVRSDAAIATDRSAELALINADENSGAGAYDNTVDALEEGNVKKVNETTVQGTGTSLDKWRG